MNATIAAQMTGADFLKLRKKRGTLIWALVLALAPGDRVLHGRGHPALLQPHQARAGRRHPDFTDGLRVMALLFGPLAAILIGVEAGTGDVSAGVFRDLVVTGRSRVRCSPRAFPPRSRCAGW